jgi:hypothetical protein
LQQLPKEAYLYWFLPKQLLVHRMPATARRYTERLPKDITQFRSINFSNPNFKTSGLFRELIEGHYMLLENMGQSLDSIAIEMNKSTEYLITNLKDNEVLLNTVSEKLFNYFEKHSLFAASEYLAVRMLANNQCVLNDDFLNVKDQSLSMKSRYEVMLYLQGYDSNFFEQTPEAVAMKEIELDIMAEVNKTIAEEDEVTEFIATAVIDPAEFKSDIDMELNAEESKLVSENTNTKISTTSPKKKSTKSKK